MKMFLPHKQIETLGIISPKEEGFERMMILRNMVPYDGVIIEVGCHLGSSSNFFCAGNRKVYCVDVWDDANRGEGSAGHLYRSNQSVGGWETVFQTFLKNCGEDFLHNIIPIRAPSEIVSKYWRVPADLIFIDAGHTYEEVKWDIILWWNCLKWGGAMAGDDFHPNWGVYEAVNDIFPCREEVYEQTWLIEKDKESAGYLDDYLRKHDLGELDEKNRCVLHEVELYNQIV